MADGTAEKPWDLATALNQPSRVQPGDTIWLRGGTYRGEFWSRLSGSASAPIVVRQKPGERAIIDGGLKIEGSHTYYWGFEVMSSDPQRISSLPGGQPDDMPRWRTGLSVYGPNNKLIHLVVHDLSQGLFAGASAIGLELAGNLIYNNGWVGADRAHGHNMYLQNATPTKYVFDNVAFGSFGYGLHIYGSEVAELRYFQIEGNTIFESGAPAADRFGTNPNVIQYGGKAMGSTVFRGNSFYQRGGMNESVRIGIAAGAPGTDVEFSQNVVYGRTGINEMDRLTISDNWFTSGPTPLLGGNVLIGLRLPVQGFASHTWDKNRYAAAPGGTQTPFYVVESTGSVSGYQFSQWRTVSGYDRSLSSTFSDRFTGAKVIVRPSRHEPGRAFITVWNWEQATALDVDLSGVLKPGDRYQIHHVYDVFGAPVTGGEYGGGPVRIPQPAVAPPVPIGYRAYGAPTPDFAVFLVRKVQ